MAYRRLEQRKAARRQQSAGSRPPTRTSSTSAPEGGRRQAWTRVVRSRTDAVAARLSSPVAGSLAAGWSAILTLLAVGAVVVMAWVLGAGSGSITDAMHVSGISWLAAHQIPISIPQGSLSELPFGFVLIPGWLLWRAGQWATRRSGACLWRDVRSTVAMAAGVYATIGLLVATATASDEVSVSPFFALMGTGVFALLVFGGGASREAGLWPSIADRLTVAMRRRIRGALVAVVAVAFCAALLLAVSLALHFSDSLTVLDALSPGLVGNVLLLVLVVAYLPNAIVWASSYLFGTGFAVGQGTEVSPFAVDVGAVPAFPLLTAIPESAQPWMPVVLLVPLIAGALGTRVGRAVPLKLLDTRDLVERVWVAGIGAVVVAVATFIASGSLGSGSLTDLGPNAALTALAAFLLFFVGGVLGDALRHASRWIRQRRGIDSIDVRDESKDFLGVSKSLS